MSRYLSPIMVMFLFYFSYLFLGGIYVAYFLGIQLFGAMFLYGLSFMFLVVGYVAFPFYGAAVGRGGARYEVRVSWDIVFLLLSVLGAAFLFYDRYFARGIDYFSLGMAGARSVINESDRSGTVFSFLGNFFSYFFFLPLINTLFDWEGRPGRRWPILFISVMLALVLSYLMGGRTVILMVLAVAASCCVGRRLVGLDAVPRGIGVWKICFLAFVAVCFFAFVFYLRAEAFLEGDSRLYVENLCAHLTEFMLSSSEYSWSCDVAAGSGGVESLLNYFSAVLLYAFHVLWLSDFSYYAEPHSSVLLAGVSHLFFSRFGFELPVHEYAGYFVPAAAAVFHDLGLLGVVVIFFFTGFFLAFSVFFMRGGRLYVGRYSFVVLYSACLLSVLISPANLPGLLIFLMCVFLAFLIEVFALLFRSLLVGRVA